MARPGRKKGTPKTGGRQPGHKNQLTTIVKDAVTQAMILEGSDQKGKDGMIGYMRQVARDCPGPFLGLVGKIIPQQVELTIETLNDDELDARIAQLESALRASTAVEISGEFTGETAAPLN